MSLLKAEAKLSAVNELGCRLDDVLEVASQDLYRAEGAVSALKQAVSSVENLLKILDSELNEKEVDLESSKMIKSYVDRTRQTLINLSTSADNNRQTQVGKIQGFQQAVSIAKKYKDEEVNKLQIIKTALERNIESVKENEEKKDERDRPVGTRPGPSIKARRLAEETEKNEDTDILNDNADNSPVETAAKIKQKKQKK